MRHSGILVDERPELALVEDAGRLLDQVGEPPPPPHPDGVFVEAGTGMAFALLPAPTGADLLAILDRVIRRVARRLAKEAGASNNPDDIDLLLICSRRSRPRAGLAAQSTGDYDTASTFYQKAYELMPHSVLWFNINNVMESLALRLPDVTVT